MFRYLKLYTNQKINLDETLKTLVSFGFKRADQVLEMGDFAVRGGILDIFLMDFEEPVRIELIGDIVSSITSFSLKTHDTTETHSMLIILPVEGVKFRRKDVSSSLGEDIPLDNFIDLAPNDLVVHVDYGIGRFLGFEKLDVKGAMVEHMAIAYAEGDKLYIPIDNMHLVQKYVGFEGRLPRKAGHSLTRLGTKLWQRAKATARRGAIKEALELLQIEALRRTRESSGFSRDTDWQRELEESFAYEETPDQRRAITEVKQDMELPHPMDRLLCGDVGYGKTEVALRAAFKAVMDNKQVAILVPTTILAEQHFKIFRERMKSYPVNVEMLSRFRSDAEQREIIKDVAGGAVDIIIGTHRLLSDDVSFKDLGLVIIDEEQRFGVKHKEKLKKLRSMVYVLTLTATPIPRTLYLALMGAKDISVINTPPPNRLPIESVLMEYDIEAIKDAIMRELKRGGQVYFVHNRIKGIDKITRELTGCVKEARFATAHGQMAAKELEKTMLDFIEGRIDVLVATNIIESGLDIPNVNTIFINRSDAFGLSELYQLKGRVGRFNVKAYAYFIIPKGSVLSEDSRKRLMAIEAHKGLGAGFKIAMEDMKLRGAGNILGLQQHGYVNSVGFDLYCRLLREAIRSLKASGRV